MPRDEKGFEYAKVAWEQMPIHNASRGNPWTSGTLSPSIFVYKGKLPAHLRPKRTIAVQGFISQPQGSKLDTNFSACKDSANHLATFRVLKRQ